ncbi:hypothetical protein K488DRAFT_90471 [Vararia minispora EC-137]|uniref:Uncharacterized protein n=1 Tax=Vararia minispora EC-137 TaxID=1314806 RepID=A0ACB8Q7H7_9AGAM|nr:hypothetical protein K488DRAFT_90471 [Vararia minispora EC-137]
MASPICIGVGSISNYAHPANDVKYSVSIRECLVDELSVPGKILLPKPADTLNPDESDVYLRLKIKAVDDAVVDGCVGDTAITRALDALSRISADTTITKLRKEKLMYFELQTIFDRVRMRGDGHFRFYRSQRSPDIVSNANPISEVPRKLEFDFSLSTSAASQSKSFWRDQQAWIEAKPSISDTPVTQNGVLSQVSGSQCADYARMHMSGSHFRVFSVGFLVFGVNLCTTIFDRDGVVFSPTLSLEDPIGRRTFFKLVYSLAFILSEVELGLDPTVIRVPPSLVPDNKGYPAFIIPPLAPDEAYWITAEASLWTSVSLLGRGTCVWPVRALESKDPRRSVKDTVSSGTLNPVLLGASSGSKRYILKNAWRRVGRDSESLVYQYIQSRGEGHPGIARWTAGADVGVSVAGLHAQNPDVLLPIDSQVLHRLVIEPVGKALNKYDTELELLKGFKMSLEGHKWLCDMGILHRDISPGDLFLSDDPEVPGFLADVESAIISGDLFSGQDAFETRTRTIDEAVVERRSCDNYLSPSAADLQSERIEFTNTQRRGAVMTGTLQFMAREVLEALRDNDSIRRTPEHDVEAFMNVFGYSLLYRLCRRTQPGSDAQKFFEMSFTDAFASLSVSCIPESRMSSSTLSWICAASKHGYLPPEIMSRPLRRLVLRLYHLYIAHKVVQLDRLLVQEYSDSDVEDQLSTPVPANLINHKDILKAIEKTIKRLEAKDAQFACHGPSVK